MGGNKKSKHKQKKETLNKNVAVPLVSICTPTYNRRPFIKSMIACFNHQIYPKDKLEWIIIDDGTDKIEDLVVDIPQVKYYKYDEKMPLGKKRNLMHEKSSGEILVYMDDDDYYPPERVSHAVTMLQTHPKAICAGASEIYIYFKHITQMIQFGPYGPNHATAGTFAFKRELLKDHAYDNDASLAEEKAFLKNYTVPFVQLEPKKTILVFSHEHNTFDKKKLLEDRHPKLVRDSDRTIDEFIKQPELKEFYMNEIEKLLVDYEPGRPEMKPDVLKQIDELTKSRKKMMEDHQQEMGKLISQLQDIAPRNPMMAIDLMEKNPMLKQHMLANNSQIFKEIQQNAIKQQQMTGNSGNNNSSSMPGQQIMGNMNGEQVPLNNDQIVEILQQQQTDLEKMTLEIKEKDKQIKEKDKQIKEKDKQIKEKDKQIKEKDKQIEELKDTELEKDNEEVQIIKNEIKQISNE